MKLEMKTLYCTPERTVQPGQVAQFDNDEAEKLIAGGFAVPVDQEGQVRTRPVSQPAKRARGKQPAGKGDGDGGGDGQGDGQEPKE